MKWVQILFILMVALSSILAPVLSNQEPYRPDNDIFSALPRVMAPGPQGASDGPSLEGTLVAYASSTISGDGSSIMRTPNFPWDR